MSHDDVLKDMYEESWSSQGIADHSHLLTIAAGYESGGPEVVLDVLHGEMIEEVIRCGV